MAYDLDHSEPRLPSNLSFQVTVSIRNFVVHRCIIDEGASTCVMPTSIWQKMGSPPLQPSSTALRAYDGHSAQPQGLLTNVPVQLAGKMVLINIEVINAQLDYNLLLGRSYMYAMRAVASTVFRIMMFPHEGRVVKVDQLTYYDPKAAATPENVLPMIEQTISGAPNTDGSSIGPMLPIVEQLTPDATTSLVSSVGPGVYSDPPMTSIFPSLPPPSSTTELADLLTLSHHTRTPNNQPPLLP